MNGLFFFFFTLAAAAEAQELSASLGKNSGKIPRGCDACVKHAAGFRADEFDSNYVMQLEGVSPKFPDIVYRMSSDLELVIFYSG